MQKAGGAYIEIRGSDKQLQGDLDKAHGKVVSAAKKMESSVTKAFKRMAVVAAAAFAVVAYKTISLVKETALLAARFETLDIVMKQVGKNAGYTAEEMDRYDKALRKTGISMIESRNSLARMAQAQLDLSQATILGRIAQDAAVIGNINSSEAFQRMIYGIQSGRTLILRTIGINVNFANSYKKIAEETNRTVASFSESEKAIIRQNVVIEYGSRIAGTYEAAMTTAGKKLSSFTRYVEDFKVKMGLAFGPATVTLVDAATTAMKQMQDEISRPEAQESLRVISGELSDVVVTLGKELPSKIANITKKAEMLWKITTYDPAIIEFGVIGLVLFGRQGGKYVAYIAAMAHFATWAGVLGKAMGLVAAGILDISQVATANFKELEEIVKRFEFPDPLKDLQLQAKELEQQIALLKKVTEGQIFTFREDKEELIKLQEKLKDVQATIETLNRIKVLDLIPDEAINQAERLKQALEDPSKYYGALPDTATANVYKQTEEMKARYIEYYAALEEMAENADMRAIMRERERLKELEPFIAARHEIWLSAYEAEEARLDEYASYRTGQEKSITEQIRAIRMTDKTFALATLKEKYENYKNFTDDLIGLELWRAAKEKEIQESGYDDMTNAMMGWANNFSSTLNDMLWGAEVTFASILESFMKMITQMLIQIAIIDPLVAGITGGGIFKGITSLFSAQGNVFSQAGLHNFAQGGIVNKPTQFAFAGGAGLMGEAGPEAIMPLARTHRGDLGVKAVGEPSDRPQKQTINVIMNNPTFQDLETQRQTMAQIASVVAAQVAPGAVIENYENDLGIRQMVRGGI